MFHPDLNIMTFPDLHNSLTLSFSGRVSKISLSSWGYAEHQSINIELSFSFINVSTFFRQCVANTTFKFVWFNNEFKTLRSSWACVLHSSQMSGPMVQ